MQTVILAGGLATRMRPLTENFPKALLPIAGHPFIHWQLKHLAQTGVTDVVLCVGFRGDMIQDFVKDGSEWGLKVKFVDEGKDLRGTAGAIRLALDQGVLEERFLITYGDSYLPVSFQKVWESYIDSGLPAIMTVYKNQNQFDKSNVWFEEGKIKVYDKFVKPDSPYFKNIKYIDYGLTGLNRETVKKEIPSGVKSDLAELFHRLSLKGELAGWDSPKRFYEIGSQEGLKELDTLMQKATHL